LAAFTASNSDELMGLQVNVQPSGWPSVFPNSVKPLFSALACAYVVPRDIPAPLNDLVKRIEGTRPITSN
jgi:hypothetical protein